MDTPAPKMEAHAATAAAPAAGRIGERPAAPDARDPFRLGYRDRVVTAPDGSKVWEQIPLTAEDLVYPQEGDHVSQGLPHFSFLLPHADALRRHLEKRPSTVVTSDVLLILRHDGKTCAPDVAVIAGDFDPAGIPGAIPLEAVGGQLVFAFEVVSNLEKELEDKDLKKNMKRYAREGVEEYFTVYPVVERQARDLVGRRLEQGRFVEIRPDAEGRVYSQKLGLFFHIDPESKELVVVDAETDERLLRSDEEEMGRRQAEAERKKVEAALRLAEERAEQGLRRKIEDLCGLLGIELTAEHRTAIAEMGSAELEALWTDILAHKRWS